ncbi:MAG: hypothetical protein ACO1NO_03950, partial [Burkholderiaceae bacterium]
MVTAPLDARLSLHDVEDAAGVAADAVMVSPWLESEVWLSPPPPPPQAATRLDTRTNVKLKEARDISIPIKNKKQLPVECFCCYGFI